MNKILETEHLTAADIERAATLLLAGELVAFPTETVYGLGACISLNEAIEKIFIVKGRPSDNPLIVHISDLSQIDDIAKNIPEDFYRLAEAFFPGPLTVVLEKKEWVPAIVSAGLTSVAVRMPSHPIALDLINKVGQPIVAPSANISGTPSATHFDHVIDDFEGKIAAVIEGVSSDIGIESTVVSLLGDEPMILRPGYITKESLENVLKKTVHELNIKTSRLPVASPGIKYRHYAPKAKVRLFFTKEEIKRYLDSEDKTSRLLLSSFPIEEIECSEYAFLSAKTLYAALRAADQKNYHEVIVFCDKTICQDVALMNRLSKAAEADS